MIINGLRVQLYQSLAPVKKDVDEYSSPTVDRLSSVGSTSLTGRQRAVTSQFRSLKRNVPTVDLRQVSPLNAMKIQQIDADLASYRDVNPVRIQTRRGSRFLMEQGSRFTQVYDFLTGLRLRSGELRNPDNFNLRTASSKNPDVLTVLPDKDTPFGAYRITVRKIAKSHELGSSVSSNTSQALGLSGSIRINGWSVQVDESDSLVSIRDKINLGEDVNSNATLDRAEDINANGVIDVNRVSGVYTQEGYLGSFYYNEDINGNGVLDGAEDTNTNKRLDGGSNEVGIRAVISGDQLILINQEPADVEIRFKDPDRILERIGFLFRHDATGDVSTNKLNDQTQEPQKAELSVNGLDYTSTMNRFVEDGSGLMLTLKKTGTSDVKVDSDPDPGLSQIVRFSVSYNSALEFINEIIRQNGAISNNIRLQTIQSDTVRAFFTAPPEAKGNFNSVSDIGIKSSSREPTSVNQLTYENLPERQKDALSLPGPGGNSLFGQTDRIGINSAKNFTINLDKNKVKQSLVSDSASAGDLLRYASERLQKKLDVHLQPEYGTIAFQNRVIDYYRRNQQDVEEELSRAVKLLEGKVTVQAERNIFRSLA